MNKVELLLERSSKAAKRRRRRERAKRKEKIQKRLKAKDTKKDPYAEIMALSKEVSKDSNDKGKGVDKRSLAKVNNLRAVHHSKATKQISTGTKAMDHLSKQNPSGVRGRKGGARSSQDDVQWGSPSGPRTPEYKVKTDPIRDRLKKRKENGSSFELNRKNNYKRKNIKPTRLGTRLAKNLLTFESTEDQNDD